MRLRDRTEQVVKSNSYAAQSVAITMREQLRHLSFAVVDASRDEKLLRLMEQNTWQELTDSDKQALAKHVKEIYQRYRDPGVASSGSRTTIRFLAGLS